MVRLEHESNDFPNECGWELRLLCWGFPRYVLGGPFARYFSRGVIVSCWFLKTFISLMFDQSPKACNLIHQKTYGSGHPDFTLNIGEHFRNYYPIRTKSIKVLT